MQEYAVNRDSPGFRGLAVIYEGVGDIGELGDMRRRVDDVLRDLVRLFQDHIEVDSIRVYCSVAWVGTGRGCGGGAHVSQETGGFIDAVRPDGVARVVGSVDVVPGRIEGQAVHTRLGVERDVLEVGTQRSSGVNTDDIRAVTERVGIDVVRGLVGSDNEDAMGRGAISVNSDGGVVAEVSAIFGDRIRGPAVRLSIDIYRLEAWGDIPAGLNSVEVGLVVRESDPRMSRVGGNVFDQVECQVLIVKLERIDESSTEPADKEVVLGSHSKGQEAHEGSLGEHDGGEGVESQCLELK